MANIEVPATFCVLWSALEDLGPHQYTKYIAVIGYLLVSNLKDQNGLIPYCLYECMWLIQDYMYHPVYIMYIYM